LRENREVRVGLEKGLYKLKKHTVSFDEAQTVFDDPPACIFDTKWNSFGEQRELIIGYSNNKQLLIVSFTEKLPGVTRVIDARHRESVKIIKTTEDTEQIQGMLSEYHFDFSKAKPNRFTKQADARISVTLDPDVARVFTTSEAVNKALRAILVAPPNS